MQTCHKIFLISVSMALLIVGRVSVVFSQSIFGVVASATPTLLKVNKFCGFIWILSLGAAPYFDQAHRPRSVCVRFKASSSVGGALMSLLFHQYQYA